MSARKLKVAFAGTPEFAAVALRALVAAQFDVGLVLTQPDRPAGRGMKRVASPVKQVALEAGIVVAQPERLSTPEQRAALADYAPDVLIVAAYGIILPRAALDLPRLGCVNIHASLLPRWRGAAPIHRAIEAGDRETGITIMQMDEGLDTGPMLLARALPIAPDDTTATLHDRLAALGAELVIEALEGVAAGTIVAQPQPEAGVTYAHKLTRAEAALDWREPAEIIARQVRAFNPFPAAQTQFNDVTFKVWHAVAEDGAGEPGRVLAADREGIVVGCGTGVVRILELQKPGGRRMAVDAFLAGVPLAPGDSFDVAQA